MKIAVSSCLLGIPCRFDGEARKSNAVVELCEKCEVVRVCPETFGGLTRPRDPSEVTGPAFDPRVVSSGGEDVTEAFLLGAKRSLEKAQAAGCKLAILKSKSPSCACGQIFDGTFTGALVPGYGIATRMFREAGIRVVTERQVEEMLAMREGAAAAALVVGGSANGTAFVPLIAGGSVNGTATVPPVAGGSAVGIATVPLIAEKSSECPVLITDRLVLKAITREDEDAVLEYCRVPEVGFLAGWPPHKTIEDTRAFIDEIASAPHVFGIFERLDGSAAGAVSETGTTSAGAASAPDATASDMEPADAERPDVANPNDATRATRAPGTSVGPCIGSVGLIPDPHRRNPDCLMLGYALSKSAWGKGYMTEASGEVLRYGFDQLGLSMITSNCFTFNNRSLRVLEKLGFVHEGVMRGVEPTSDGFMQDLHMFSLMREEFENL